MATLQAARASILGLPKDSAYSWGLNRAIFYAAAKRGFKGGAGASKGRASAKDETTTKERRLGEYLLGSEKAFIDRNTSSKDRPIFSIGDKTQTRKDFEKQIVSRFGTQANFEKAWEEALKIVQDYEWDTLISQEEFYESVYKPRRDELSEQWTKEFAKKVAPSVRS